MTDSQYFFLYVCFKSVRTTFTLYKILNLNDFFKKTKTIVTVGVKGIHGNYCQVSSYDDEIIQPKQFSKILFCSFSSIRFICLIKLMRLKKLTWCVVADTLTDYFHR